MTPVQRAELATNMQRAAVLIGVSKTEKLQQLQAVNGGVSAMKEWALAQGMKPAHIKEITDTAGPVTARDVKQAVRELVDLTTIDQLIVYFAGHGVNIAYGEYWLLSDAPSDTQEAINVDGSIVLARQCSIPHVVLISDACRTAADGIQAQRVTGSEMFPNEDAIGATGEQAVDVFFATALGRPALEIREAAAAANAYRAVYTDALAEALRGKHPEILDTRTVAEKVVSFVRPWPLKRHLTAELAKRLEAANVDREKWAPPDARITSPADAWLAQLTALVPPGPAPPAAGEPAVPRAPARGPGGASITLPAPRSGAAAPAASESAAPETFLSISERMLRDALGRVTEAVGSAPPTENRSGDAGRAKPALDMGLAASVRRAAAPFGPAHFETNCGFKVRGASLQEAFSTKARVDVGDARDIARVHDIHGPAANVLLTFADGSGVVLPAIPDFITAVTIEDHELVNVVYEPSDSSWRWQALQEKLEELRRLRAIVAASARLGAFRLEGDNALELARRMQYAKGIDPTMGLYAAYAYHDLQRKDRIREMHDYMRGDLQLALFDIALLGRQLYQQRIGTTTDVFPFLPLLSQGWALLAAHRLSLPPSLDGIRRRLSPSLWTLYDDRGAAQIRAALQSGEIR